MTTFLLKRIGTLLAAVVIALAIWSLVLVVFDVNPLIGRQPWQVFDWLVTADGAAENRELIGSNLLVTLRDAGIGYLVGLVAAFLLAVIFCISPVAERIVMPTAMVLRSIPLVVMTPLITLIFGRDLVGVTVIVIIVVFLPALANILFGLRSVTGEHRDLVLAYGGSSWTVLRKVALPAAIPATLASARVSVPSAVTGAMIAEWLSTGEGLGGAISRAAGSFGYDQMWASAIVIAAVTMIAYAIVSVADTLVLERMGQLS
ncbi:ABC transporter permease subunit [Cellulomonas sp. NPDC089187]|uniref:ABC transporter permease n=1 Tax=Cellulomonas sp. NPDC089187 TaxID=3154970 RepID=UPI0034253A1A